MFDGIAEILSECKGSDIGVLVCGPRKMRHEVAKICSSGLADKLHLESISFNWWCIWKVIVWHNLFLHDSIADSLF